MPNHNVILSNDKPDKTLRLDEKAHVENPLLDQLEKFGWTVLRLEQKQEPQESFRQHFGQVVLLPKLEEALRKINPFLRAEQVAEVARRITTFSQKNLIELKYLPGDPFVAFYSPVIWLAENFELVANLLIGTWATSGVFISEILPA